MGTRVLAAKSVVLSKQQGDTMNINEKTRSQFKNYSDALELKDAVDKAMRRFREVVPCAARLKALNENPAFYLKEAMNILLSLQTEIDILVSENKQATVEERGYIPSDRGMMEYTGNEKCKSSCGSGGSGGCGGCSGGC